MAMERTYLIRTFGCQMNEHDSERIAGLLTADGMTPTDDVADAGVVVFNTCAIRENADNRLYGNLGHLKPLKDETRACASSWPGCLAQKDRGEIQTAGAVGRRRGRHARPAAAARAAGDVGRRRAADGRPRVHGDLPQRAAGRARRRRSGVGLDRSRVRQRLHVLHRAARPRPAAVALDRRHPGGGPGPRGARCRRGHAARPEREHVRPRRDGPGLVAAARSSPSCCVQVGAVEGIRRVRFTSPHPHDFTPDVIEAMAETPARLRAHPLPVAVRLGPRPEGDAPLLPSRSLPRLARRDPRRRSPTSRCRPTSSSGSPARPRRTSPTRSISSRRARFDSAYTFQYSPRPGTRAASFDDQVPKEVVQERFDRLVELQQRISLERSLAQVGAHVRGAGRGGGQAGAVDAGTDPHEPDRAPRPTPLEPGTFVRRPDHGRLRAPPGRRAWCRRRRPWPSEVGRHARRRSSRSSDPTAVGKTDLSLAHGGGARRRDRVDRLDARVSRDGRRHGQAVTRRASPRPAPPDRRRRAIRGVLGRSVPAAARRGGRRDRRAGRQALLVGGSGLYFRAIVDDLEFPGTDPATRADLEREASGAGTRARCTSGWPPRIPSRPRRIEPGERPSDRPGARGAGRHRPTVLLVRGRVGAVSTPRAVRAVGLRMEREVARRAGSVARVVLHARRGLARRGPCRSWNGVRRMAHRHPGHRLR